MYFSPTLFPLFPTRKIQDVDFAENRISSDSFYPSVGSISGKTMSNFFFTEMGCPRPLHQSMHTAEQRAK
jgi:hypothetical protein